MEQPVIIENFEEAVNLPKYFIDILNAVPSIVYWVDDECHYAGCNLNYIHFLGLTDVKDLKGTPYDQMRKHTSWADERIEEFRLDDMKVIFSGQGQVDIEEAPVTNQDDEEIHFLSRRIPLLDKNKNTIGLVVVLTDITEQKKQKEQIKEKSAKPKKKTGKQKKVAEPNVLVIEDNVIAQKVEKALLTSLHCHVDIAESGEKAMKLFKLGKYDIVLLDIGLEDTSGYMLAKKIRQLEENTKFHVPIIALTSYQADIVKYDCNEYKMDGVLTKPLTSEQADQLIKHFINHEDTPVNNLKTVEEE